jgi:hypothetical protein
MFPNSSASDSPVSLPLAYLQHREPYTETLPKRVTGQDGLRAFRAFD